jgi:hypothetical protein
MTWLTNNNHDNHHDYCSVTMEWTNKGFRQILLVTQHLYSMAAMCSCRTLESHREPILTIFNTGN